MKRWAVLQAIYAILIVLTFVFVVMAWRGADKANRQIERDVVALEALTADNRAALRSLCATTTAIHNLDQFFLGVAIPRANETEDQRKVRLAFVKLIKSDIARMDRAGDVCARLRPPRR